MNLQRLRVGEWIFGVSGVVLLVSLFLPWFGLEGEWIDLGPGGPVEGFNDSAGAVTTWSAWQVFSVADLLLALLAVLALVVWTIVARATAAGPGIAGEALLVPLAVVAAIVALVQVLSTPNAVEAAPPIPDPTTEYGAWLGLLATLGILVGLLVAMRDERLSRAGRLTDATGVPVAAPPYVERLPAPPAG
ncbi:MAG TPA: hypothetical protein VEX36_00065 [Thermoleophilaceae bacterium]|nr:hypothetical protein [Thermoleophilaceae bacterium]